MTQTRLTKAMCAGVALTVTSLAMSHGAAATAPPAVTSGVNSATPGARSAGDRLFAYLGNGGYDVQSYDVAYDYVASQSLMNAYVRIKAVARQNLSEFSLDSAGQRINFAKINGERARFIQQKEKLVIEPRSPLPKNKFFTVEIDFVADRTAAPPSPATPGQQRSISGWWDHGSDGFALLGQPDRAHLFFPMNDHPGDKARVTFRITAPKDMTAVANGTLMSRTSNGDRSTSVYATRDAIPTHVVQAAVGHFKEFRGSGPHGLPLRRFVARKSAESAAPQVDLTAQHLTWVEEQIGSPFPYENYGVLGVEEYGAALETATMSTYSADPGLSPREVPTMIHELVHQYFGDAVSPKTWDDMWISEGHATFYTFVYQDEKKAVPMRDSMERAYEYDQENRSLSGPPGRLANAADVLGSTNAPGALMLYGLRQQLGAEVFQSIEKTFIERYCHKNATTQNYIEIVNEISGHDFTNYINEWIYGSKTPPMPS
ncbi:M1 family metallopeptidase [Streptomyces sp. NPDC096538]|uniref:M1 family metallopeptidase n=1 Tax=Streptomyces sp. NPDC096538 TaxID=3155427 RepID=UPI00332552EC